MTTESSASLLRWDFLDDIWGPRDYSGDPADPEPTQVRVFLSSGTPRLEPTGSDDRAVTHPDFRDETVLWPSEAWQVETWQKRYKAHRDLWVVAHPFGVEAKGRGKQFGEGCPPARAVWADLDECPPSELRLKPTWLVESSPGRWQAWWVLEEPQPLIWARSVSNAVYLAHKNDGADAVHNVGRIMRVPGTGNHKQRVRQGLAEAPMVRVADRGRRVSAAELAEAYPPKEPSAVTGGWVPEDVPEGWGPAERRAALDGLPEDLREVLERPPEAEDRSAARWGLILRLRAEGVSDETAYNFLSYPPHPWNKMPGQGRAAFVWGEIRKSRELEEREEERCLRALETALGPLPASAPTAASAPVAPSLPTSGTRPVGWWGGPVPACLGWDLLRERQDGKKGRLAPKWENLERAKLERIVSGALGGVLARSGAEDGRPERGDYWFWRADTGSWDPRGRQATDTILKALLGSDLFDGGMSERAARLLWADARHVDFSDRRPEGVVSVPDGRVLMLDTLTERPALPDDWITTPGRVAFDPEAECPAFEGFLASSGKAFRVPLLELVGFSVYEGRKPQQLVVAVGSGGSGKSTLEHAARAVSSPGQVLSRRFQQLKQDFGLESAERANWLFMDDLPNRVSQADVDMLKPLVSWGRVPVNRKGRPIVEQSLDLIPVLTCEVVPSFVWSLGLERRLVVFPFPAALDVEVRDDLPDRFAEEATGIFRLAAEALSALLGSFRSGGRLRLSETRATEFARDSLRGEFDDIGRFVNDYLEFGNNFRVKRSSVRKSYEEWCEDIGLDDGSRLPPKMFWPRLEERAARAGVTAYGEANRRWQCGMRVLRGDELAARETENAADDVF